MWGSVPGDVPPDAFRALSPEAPPADTGSVETSMRPRPVAGWSAGSTPLVDPADVSHAAGAGRERTICSRVTNPAKRTLAQGSRGGGGTHTSSQAVTGTDQLPRWDPCRGHASALPGRGAAGAGYPAATPRFVAGASAGCPRPRRAASALPPQRRTAASRHGAPPRSAPERPGRPRPVRPRTRPAVPAPMRAARASRS